MKIDQTIIKLLISGLDELEANYSEKAVNWCTNIPSIEKTMENGGINFLEGEIDQEFETYRDKIATLKAGLWSALHTIRQDEAIKHLMEDINE